MEKKYVMARAFPVEVDYSKTIADYCELKQFDTCNPHVTDVNFLPSRFGRANIAVRLIRLNDASKFAEIMSAIELDRSRPLDICELMASANTELTLGTSRPCIALRSLWLPPGEKWTYCPIITGGEKRRLEMWPIHLTLEKYWDILVTSDAHE